MNIKAALEKLVPGAKYIDNIEWSDGQFPEITPQVYEDIIWLDDRTKPDMFDVGICCLNILKDVRCNEIDKLRDEKLAVGAPYNFPNDIFGHIQIRDEKDRINVLTNGNVGLVYVINNQPNSPMTFRDKENKIHNMSALEIMNMSLYAASFGQNIYTTSWLHKDHIRDYEILEQTINGIQNGYGYISNYDITIGW